MATLLFQRLPLLDNLVVSVYAPATDVGELLTPLLVQSIDNVAEMASFGRLANSVILVTPITAQQVRVVQVFVKT